MGVNKLGLAAAGISMLLWIATPVLAAHGHGGGNAFSFGSAEKHGGHHFKTDKHSDGHHFETTDNPHSNKHGKDRGLDRANDVAGPHGQQGRANAATHQSNNGSPDSDSDSE
jgi:hypothetical protein